MNANWNGRTQVIQRRWFSHFTTHPGGEALEIRVSAGRRGYYLYAKIWHHGYVIGPHYIVKDGT